MIAKANVSCRGGDLIAYIVGERGKLHPEKIFRLDAYGVTIWNSANGIYYEMVDNMRSHGRNLKYDTLSVIVSPSDEHTKEWKDEDWIKFNKEFLQIFGSLEMQGKNKKLYSGAIPIMDCQRITALHRESKGEVVHIHNAISLVSMNGKSINTKLIQRRAKTAAEIIAERYGWKTAREIGIEHNRQISADIMEILRAMPRFTWDVYSKEMNKRGYTIEVKEDSHGKIVNYVVRLGNNYLPRYKSSDLGKSRNLTASRIEDTWRKLQQISEISEERKVPSIIMHDSEVVMPSPDSVICPTIYRYEDIDGEDYEITVTNPDVVDILLDFEEELCDEAMEFSDEAGRAILLLFAGYLEAALYTCNSCGCSGGGTTSDLPWRDPEEDDEEWALRCRNHICQMFNTAKKPKINLKR